MAGPVERRLRERLLAGATEQDAVADLGELGRTKLRRYIDSDMVTRGADGKLYLQIRAKPERVRALQAKQQLEQRTRETAERAGKLAAEHQERERQRREQLDRLDAARTPEEKARVLQELRSDAAQAKSKAFAARALAKAREAKTPMSPAFAELFGIEFDNANP